MAIPFRSPIDLGKLEITNVAMQNLATAPSSPASGQFYFDTDDDSAYVWDGAAWSKLSALTAAEVLALVLTADGSGSGLDADLLDGQSGAHYLARANHTGTQAAATISDFDTQVR